MRFANEEQGANAGELSTFVLVLVLVLVLMLVIEGIEDEGELSRGSRIPCAPFGFRVSDFEFPVAA